MLTVYFDCASLAQVWIEEVSAYLKTVDPNHMVTVGEEGFYGFGSPNVDLNPNADATGYAVLPLCPCTLILHSDT
jgi:endo-1,4-beta-mannosidase